MVQLYLWKWNYPTKVKLFCWIALENKLLTWDNYIKRGGVGPNICLLFFKEEKYIDHLLVNCSLTKLVWKEVNKVLNIHGNWDSQTFESNLKI